MAKKIIIIISIAIALTIAYWLISPLFINKQVSEALPMPDSAASESSQDNTLDTTKINEPTKSQEPQIQVLKSGPVQGEAGHSGTGTISLIKSGDKYYIRMEDDFDIINGPDLFVYLGNNGGYDKNINLGALKGNQGAQNYEIKDSGVLENHDEVWIWCRAFSVPFVSVKLK